MEQRRFFGISLSYLLLLGTLAGTAQGQDCGIENFPRREQFLLNEDIDFQLPNKDLSIGYLFIVPQLKFDCHGTITSWHALTNFNTVDAALDVLFHDITFQLWRPSAEDNRVYCFVGSNIAQFTGNEIRAGRTILEDGTLFSNLTSIPSTQERLQFQPGDVIGWYIHTGLQATQQPLSIVYRHATSDDNSVDLFSTVISDSDYAATPPPCDVAVCSTNTTSIPSVIPYITVEYETLSNPSEAGRLGPPLCVNTSSLLDDCPATSPDGPSTTAPPSPLTTTPVDPSIGGGDGSQIFTLPVIGALAATGAVILVALVIFIILLVLCMRGRTCILFSGRAKKRQASFRDNPTYTSPDDFIRGESPSTPGSVFHPAVQHYQANNGALYAVPDANQSLTNSTTKLDPSQIFDGECYATTYQTNGQCHVYQELTEMPPKFSSQSTLHITKQELPDLPKQHHRNSHGSLRFKNFQNSAPRFSISTGTIPAAQFPYTLPNTPAPSHPYLEAVDSRPLQQNRTPDTTPPHSADLPLQGNAPVRRLFHAIDDEGYHVPTHEERMQFLGNSSTEELYSRLSRPHARSRDSREVNFFEQSDLYWEPPASTPELYNQLAMRKYREIHKNQIHVIKALGSGHFGAVSRGYWEVPGGRVDVAIKFLQPGSKEEDKALFLQEAAIMGQFLHPNIVKLHGVVTVEEPMMIVLELMPKGDLKNYLKELKSRVPNLPMDLPELFLNFCRQISYGMNYLSNKQFIHRDLAARNILLTDDLTCKIGDFGMTRALDNDETYQSRGGRMPLKWTAPEALNYQRFTPGSDVWSYGIVLFEIWSLGEQPFKRVSEPSKLMSLVNSGHCQPPPPGCPRAIYRLMVNCWHPLDESRPRFSQICDYLGDDDDTLLNWDHADRIVSPSVTHIGAPLTEARNLYPDLQFCYDNDTEV